MKASPGESVTHRQRSVSYTHLRQIIVLAGRPYHADEEINHGIDKLICSYGAAVITEAVSYTHLDDTLQNILDAHAHFGGDAGCVHARQTNHVLHLVGHALSLIHI